MNKLKGISGVIVTAGLVAGLAACGNSGTDVSSASPSPTGAAAISEGAVLKDGANATGDLAANTQVAQFDKSIFDQYTGPTDEMVNDGKRDLTLNDPNRVGYVYVFASTGQLLTFYTILGKVSSVTSQLTESQDIVDDPNCVTGFVDGGGSGAGYTQGQCSDVVNSLGDDGTYGGEEGGDAGVFFFTTADALVELGGPVDWFYSDAPLHLVSKPILSDNTNAAPTSGIVTLPVVGIKKK
jgi:hypothetical protein